MALCCQVGESGRSVKELEKTVLLLKKVVEKTRAENEQLKRGPGVMAGEKLQALQTENTALKVTITYRRRRWRRRRNTSTLQALASVCVLAQMMTSLYVLFFTCTM